MFGLFNKKKRMKIADAAASTRHAEIAADSLTLVRSTLNPKTFFGRCDDIAVAEERLTGTSTFREDIEIQTALQIEFIDRVIAAGRVDSFKESMSNYEHRLTPDALLYYIMKTDN